MRAIQAGAQNITVTASAANLFTDVNLYQATSTYTLSGLDVTLPAPADAAKFKPGDRVLLTGSTQPGQILRITGKVLRLVDDIIPAPNPNGSIQLADILPGALTIRLAPKVQLSPGVLVPGTMLTVTQKNPNATDTQMVDSVQIEPNGFGTPTYRVTFREGLKAKFILHSNNNPNAKSEKFKIEVDNGNHKNIYDNLSIDPAHPRYYVGIINNQDDSITVAPVQPPPSTPPPFNLPTGAKVLSGRYEDLSILGDIDFTNALDALTQVPDVNLVAVPGKCSATLLQDGLDHCVQRGDRFRMLAS